MLRVKQKNITSIYAPVKVGENDDHKPIFEVKTVSVVYRYGKIIWQAIASCFGRGFWINDNPWVNTDSWKNE